MHRASDPWRPVRRRRQRHSKGCEPGGIEARWRSPALGLPSFGTGEEDLYDGELAFTDHHVGRLDDWLERVYYARDARSNQVMTKLDGVLLKERPEPAFPLRGTSLDQGRVEVLGFDVQSPSKVSVYVHVVARPSAGWQLELEAVGPSGASTRKPPVIAIFRPSRWRAGELVRSDFELALPKPARSLSLSLHRVLAGAPSEVVRLGNARL